MSNLLTASTASPKLAKYTGDEYMSAILYLASAVYDRRLCPNAGACVKTCLIVHAGRGAIGGSGIPRRSDGIEQGYDNMVQRARKRKSDYLLNTPSEFSIELRSEIDKLVIKANKQGKRLAIRLNGGSDLDWSAIYKLYPSIQFWEYTKRPDLALQISKLPNVHVTYSYNERSNNRVIGLILAAGINIAKVFNIRKGKPLPVGVIDGDLHDYRFLDGTNKIVGLRLKSLRKVTDKQLIGGFIQV